ncbi:phosphoribosylglycinamide formyltransferase [Candidatus Hydrogenedentota bacterium]
MTENNKIRLAVLLSGGGTTLENILEHIDVGKLDADVAVVISSRADAYGLERAKKHGVPARLVARKDFSSTKEHAAAVNAVIDEFNPDLIVLAGFMSLLKIEPEYIGKIINIHPALIPAFCGHKMYGHHVHEAVLEYGAKISGCTVHFVDEEYDNGPVILQKVVPVQEDDTPETLAARVFQAECQAYPEAIQLFAEGRLEIEGRRVRVH